MEGSVLLQQVNSKLAEKRPVSEQKIKARATLYVIFTCLVSAMSGALFGYDGGISGGVSIMPGFASKFFPGKRSLLCRCVLVPDSLADSLFDEIICAEQLAENSGSRSYYCRRNDAVLQLFASVMYFTGEPFPILDQKPCRYLLGLPERFGCMRRSGCKHSGRTPQQTLWAYHDHDTCWNFLLHW